jgi:hypothetical protein
MSELDQLARAMRDSNELWQLGKSHEALNVLDGSIKEAIRQKKDEWVQVLCRHAALISESTNDLLRAKHYNEQALVYGPDNPMALYGLAKVLSEQGEPELAKQYAIKCRHVVRHSSNNIYQGLLDLLDKRWPEIAKP